ncbi:MAG: hypothetical protein J3K34DRAFT_520724 [Monoraphidium minutum]|nr:MAG: hypothetical protein J3K34DRAFT_520724 [Monoraphidium minutum]
MGNNSGCAPRPAPQAPTMAVSFAAYFDSHHLADAEVRFITAGAGAGAPPLSVMPGHQLVLKGASDLWAAQLERWQEGRAAAGGCGGCAPPAVSIGLAGPHELALGRDLVRVLYTGAAALAPAGGGESCAGQGPAEEARLLRLLELAHCALLEEVAAVVCGALAALLDRRLGPTWATVEALMAVPDALAAAPEFAPLAVHAARGVAARLGDLELALDEAESVAALARLPAPALVALLSGGALRAASEASVVAAVGAWMAARGGAQNVNAEVCRSLLRCVRLAHLPQTYSASCLLQQAWVVKSEVDCDVAKAVALLALPDAMAPARRMALAAAGSLRKWRRHWFDAPRRPASRRGELYMALPEVGEARLRAMFEAVALQLGQRHALAARADGGPQRPEGEGGAAKRRKGGGGGAEQPPSADVEQGERGGAASAGDKAGAGGADGGSAEEACTCFWAGFHWRAALRWAPAASGGGGRGRGGGPTPLQLQVALTAEHAFCKRGAALQLAGASIAVESYRRAAAAGGGTPGAAAGATPRRGPAAGAAAAAAAIAAADAAAASPAPSASTPARQRGQPHGGGEGGSGGGGGSGGKPNLYRLRQPQTLWAAGAGAAPGSSQAGPEAARTLVFGRMVPVAVAEWVCDWEGHEGMPLALADYMAGGSLRLVVRADEIL